MVNEMREKQNERDTESLRSNFSNSTLSLNNLNQKVQESKRLSRNIQVDPNCGPIQSCETGFELRNLKFVIPATIPDRP